MCLSPSPDSFVSGFWSRTPPSLPAEPSPPPPLGYRPFPTPAVPPELQRQPLLFTLTPACPFPCSPRSSEFPGGSFLTALQAQFKVTHSLSSFSPALLGFPLFFTTDSPHTFVWTWLYPQLPASTPPTVLQPTASFQWVHTYSPHPGGMLVTSV